MARLRYVDLSGTIAAGNLTNVATSHTFTAPLTYAAGVTVPTLAGSDYFMLSILNTAGTAVSEVVKVTAYNSGTGAATIVRGQAGTSGVAHTSLDKVLLAAYPDDFGGVGTGVIGYCIYAPGTTVTKTSSGTSSADIDASNLVVSFVGPPSGMVEVTRTACVTISLQNNDMRWTLRTGGSDVTGGSAAVLFSYSAVENGQTVTSVAIVSVTPGTSYTWTWGWYRQGAGASVMSMYCGDGHDISAPAVMKVEALP